MKDTHLYGLVIVGILTPVLGGVTPPLQGDQVQDATHLESTGGGATTFKQRSSAGSRVRLKMGDCSIPMDDHNFPHVNLSLVI